MTCESCGDKPKKCNKDFTKAVIEINNESIVLLRKVVVPVSLGDEETFPPKIGKYRNVILQYEANNHIYIYSSDGIPTLLETEVPQSVLNRISNLEEDVTINANNISSLQTGKQDKLTAGEHITINDNTISADSPTWTFTTTDPGEGGTLAPNNFIGVYE